MYKILKTDGRAKRAEFTTVHGTVQTPVFMNVGTVAAIKGAVATTDLQQIGTQIELSNTYHLHVRPGDKIIKQLGGLHKFMNWDKPISLAYAVILIPSSLRIFIAIAPAATLPIVSLPELLPPPL
jgi:tRNA-guanine family transglycosylase